MENNKKTYVLDTNVLLSDASALTAFQNNDVVLPLIVLEELDRHKDMFQVMLWQKAFL